MHTDSLFYRLFQERPATVFELAGLDVPVDPAYRMHAEIETILVYKFPKLTRAEIQIMLHLPETDLKKTRSYQEAYGEGEEAGAKKGELAIILRQLGSRLGSLTTQQQRQIERLSAADLGTLGEALLDFADAEDLDGWLRDKRSA